MVLTTAPSARWLIKDAACYPETEPSDLRVAGGLITERGICKATEDDLARLFPDLAGRVS